MATFPTVTVAVDFGIDPTNAVLLFDDPVRGLFDSREFGADEGDGTDITEFVRRFSIDMGKSDALSHFGEGSSSTELSNADGRFDSSNLSGPYVSGGVSLVKPMRRIRHRATWAGTTYDLSECFTEDWVTEYPKKVDAVAVCPASDYLKVLSRYKAAAASSPVGADELPGARIGRLLDLAGVPDGDRDLDTGAWALQATTLAQDVLTEARQVAEAVGGALFVDKSGRIVFRDASWLFTASRSRNVQATFSDDPAKLAAGTAFAYYDIKRSNDTDLVRNRATVTATGGTAQTVQDETSQNAYFTRAYEISGAPLASDDDALTLATGIVYVYGDKRDRFDEIIVKPRRNPTGLFPVVLGAEFGDLWSVEKVTPFGTITQSCHVVGISHMVDWSTQEWTSRFRLADAWVVDDVLIFDDATFGKLDTGTFAPF